jgi:hypothetical protein
MKTFKTLFLFLGIVLFTSFKSENNNDKKLVGIWKGFEVEKQFEGVDVQKYRELMDAEEQQRLEQQKSRGEFEKVLQETVSKKDTAIQQLQKELHSIKVDGSLLNAASAKRAINPQQVVSLLKSNIRLGDAGDVEVLDAEGNIRYTDKGVAMGVDELVEEFLAKNPHFIAAGPNGSGAKSNIANTNGKELGKIDVSSLNMNDPGDREIYRKFMKSKGIRM